MLIKINSNEELDSKLESLKSHFDVGTAAKACSMAASGYVSLSDKLKASELKVAELNNKLESILLTLNNQRICDQEINKFLSE